jgi:hypothetical protein
MSTTINYLRLGRKYLKYLGQNYWIRKSEKHSVQNKLQKERKKERQKERKI